MSWYKFLLIILLVSPAYSSYCQRAQEVTSKEEGCINVFNGFTDYVRTCIRNKTQIDDTGSIKYILLNFLFIDKNFDSPRKTQLKGNELSIEQLTNLGKELKSFYGYFEEREHDSIIQHLSIIPIRLSSDTFIYNRITRFQKENAFVFYDKRNPKATLGYILFVPPIKNIISRTKNLVMDFAF